MKNREKMKKIKFVLLCFSFLSITIQNSFAEDVSNTTETTTAIQNTTINATLVGNANDWDLTPEEWTHYQQLIDGPNALWYPKLSPPAILGMYANTSQDQEHFAEIVAHEEHDKIMRELSFNNAVHLAMLKLYPTEPLIQPFDLTPFNPVPSKK